MPLYVKAHMRKGSSVRAYRRSTSKLRRAHDLVYALGSITARGRFLSKPQKKAFKKAGDIAGRYQLAAYKFNQSVRKTYKETPRRSRRFYRDKRIK
jgi:hypothetical protein